MAMNGPQYEIQVVDGQVFVVDNNLSDPSGSFWPSDQADELKAAYDILTDGALPAVKPATAQVMVLEKRGKGGKNRTHTQRVLLTNTDQLVPQNIFRVIHPSQYPLSIKKLVAERLAELEAEKARQLAAGSRGITAPGGEEEEAVAGTETA